MTSNGRQSLKRVKWAWASIAVEPEADATRSLNIAIDKNSDMDQYFCEFEDYTLLYPDMKICNLLPGSTESFTVEKCRHFLNKHYSKINLFVCLETQFLFLVEDKTWTCHNKRWKSKSRWKLQ